ncbi:hypothetical protein OAO01_08045 [Oligoflexia bacterium]|nr:hypothetical protein [Oligoflexia bacterium]
MSKQAALQLFSNVAPAAGWSVVQNKFSEKKRMHYESLFTIGSGYISVRGVLPWESQAERESVVPGASQTQPKLKSKWGAYVPGFVSVWPGSKEAMVNLPYFLGLSLEADGEKLELQHSNVSKFKQWLDLRDGCLHLSLQWKTASGATLQINYHSYAHMVRRQLVWQNVTVTVLRGGASVRVSAFTDLNVHGNDNDHFAKTSVVNAGEVTGAVVKLHDQQEAAVLSTVIGLTRWSVKSVGRKVIKSATKKLLKGQALSVHKLTAISTVIDSKTPRNDAKAILKNAASLQPEDLYLEHRSAWDEIWSRTNIEIKGDAKSNLALRFSMFHLLRAHPRNARAAICPVTNGGNNHGDCVRWENEIFVAPFFMYTQPAWARSLLQHRFTTLGGARRKAKQLGYPGAMYAWESNSKGEEQSIDRYPAEHAIHVSSDIVLALWHYICVADDDAFLRKYAMEIIFDVARFWAARVDRLPDSSDVHLLCVMGPDEYSLGSHDNAYTNFLTARILSLAAQLYEEAREIHADLAAFVKKSAISKGDVENWKQLAAKLFIPYDGEQGLILQSSNYENQVKVDLNALGLNKNKLFCQAMCKERLYRTRVLQQADVLLLIQLFPSQFSGSEVSNAFRYYEPDTTHDVPHALATHCMICTWLELQEEAWQYFTKASAVDLKEGAYSTEAGIHSANAGALWQCVVFGFAGLLPAYLTEVLTLSPRLPKHWKGVKFCIQWHGVAVQIALTPEQVEVTTSHELEVCVRGETRLCQAGTVECFS